MVILPPWDSGLYVSYRLLIGFGPRSGSDTWRVGFGPGYLILSLVLVRVRARFEAWYSSALDIEESLSGVLVSDVHIFVADVIKSFDTVDRGILDYFLSRLGLPGWFRHIYFEYHARVRLRFKLSCGLGESWTRDGGIPQGCPLSMVFIVAFDLPWCRHLEALRGVKPQLYADNLYEYLYSFGWSGTWLPASASF